MIKNIKFLLKNIWQMNKKIYFVTFTKAIFNALTLFINIGGLTMVISSLEKNKSSNDIFKTISIYLGINLIVIISKEIIELIDNNISRKASNIMQFDYSRDSVNINYHYVQDGTIANSRRKSMLGHPCGSFMTDISDFIYYFFQLIGVIFIFSFLSPYFLILISIFSIASIFLIFKRKNNDFAFKNDKLEEDRKLEYLYKVMTEYKYAKEIRINNAEKYISEKYQNIFQKQITKLKSLFLKTRNINFFETIVIFLQTILMYFYLTYQVYYKNSITIAQYTMLISSVTVLTSALLGLFNTIASINNINKSINFYQEYKEMVDKYSNISQSNQMCEKDIDFTNAEIEFKDVSFIYPGTNKVILNKINVKIHKGEKIAIVGLNGSGKTTLVKLLTRLYDPTEGVILINGINIKDIPYHQYIQHIGVILQDYGLFSYSIKENIILNREYNDDKLLMSIEKSGLKEKIDSLKSGVETYIYKNLDTNGVEFSGGEGQKLALARVIYKDPETLLLDEPTSALDPISEFEFFQKIKNLFEDRATIFISHRLSSTKLCDRIIVLHDGKIIECGNHNDLINQKGFYAGLFNAQAKYYREKGVGFNE